MYATVLTCKCGTLPRYDYGRRSLRVALIAARLFNCTVGIKYCVYDEVALAWTKRDKVKGKPLARFQTSFGGQLLTCPFRTNSNYKTKTQSSEWRGANTRARCQAQNKKSIPSGPGKAICAKASRRSTLCLLALRRSDLLNEFKQRGLQLTKGCVAVPGAALGCGQA